MKRWLFALCVVVSSGWGESFDQELVARFNRERAAGLDLSDPLRFNALAEQVNARSRAVREISLPPFESLYVLNDANVERFMKEEGGRYSQLKYGNPEAIQTYAKRLAASIKARFGEQMAQESGQWVLASAAYYRTPNAASYLGTVIAQELGLPQVDIRVRDTYSGEFGALKSADERKQIVAATSIYVSDPHRVVGKHVIYIDDVYVSGAHLIDHYDQLIAAGAESVHPYAVFDVFSHSLTIEKGLNYAKISIEEPGPLLEILNDLQAPILTRTVKYLLRLEEEQLLEILDQLVDERVYRLFEAADAERYARFPRFASNVEVMRRVALERHQQSMPAQEELIHRNYQVMLFDYDSTLADVLTPLSEQMMDLLVHHIENGVEVAICTLQPIGERGLHDYTIKPLSEYLVQKGKPLSLLHKLHLYPSAATYYYRPTEQGELEQDRPLYNLGFPLEKKQQIYDALTEAVSGLNRRAYYRGAYVSFHFPSEENFVMAKERLEALLPDLPIPMVLKRKQTRDPNKIVLHIRVAGMTKAVARNHLLVHVLGGRSIDRGSVLVVGDHMERGGSDHEMFVFGGVNLAVGKSAAPGTYPIGDFNDGTLRFLQDNLFCSVLREEDPSEERLRFARRYLRLASLHKLTDDNRRAFFEAPVYAHKKREQQLSWAQLYSLLKYGDVEAIEFFAERLSALVPQGEELAIAVPAGYLDEPEGAVKASLLLAEAVASRLHVPLIPMGLTREQEINYCGANEASTRFSLAMQQYAPVATEHKTIVLLDDAVVSGATIWAIMQALQTSGAKVVPICLVDVLVDDFSVELTLNETSHDEEATVRSILQDPNAEITTRTLKKLLKLSPAKISSLIRSLPVAKQHKLRQVAQSSRRIQEQASPAALRALMMVGKRSQQLGLKPRTGGL